MKISRTIVVLDAADLNAVSSFWAGLLGGTVAADDDWHSVLVDGEWRLGIQLAPNHVPPDWPDGTPQQIHLDLWIDDLKSAHKEAISLGRAAVEAGRRPQGCRGLPGLRGSRRPPVLPLLGLIDAGLPDLGITCMSVEPAIGNPGADPAGR